MTIFELDDFEYWIDNSIAENIEVNSFSPLFVYLIYWAYCENKLNNELSKETSFIKSLLKLGNDKSSFSNFVNDNLDGKLCDSYFDDSVQQFVSDYFEYDGYSKDLVKCFNLNLWEMPASLDSAKKMNQFISRSLQNYIVNIDINPNVVNFSNN